MLCGSKTDTLGIKVCPHPESNVHLMMIFHAGSISEGRYVTETNMLEEKERHDTEARHSQQPIVTFPGLLPNLE